MIIVSIPFENGLKKTNGCKEAPFKIIKKLYKNIKNLNLKNIILEEGNLEKNNEIIFEESFKIFKKNKKEKIIFLGGDHSISFLIFNAFRKVYRNSCLIVLDAHIDLMKPMKEPTHEEWLRALIEKGFNVKNIFLLNGRRIYPEEKSFFCKNKFNLFRKIKSFEKEIKKLEEFEAIYITLDFDILDKKIFSATGYPSSGGLNEKQLKKILSRIISLKNFLAIDFVEYNPKKDNQKDFKVIMNIINYALKEIKRKEVKNE